MSYPLQLEFFNENKKEEINSNIIVHTDECVDYGPIFNTSYPDINILDCFSTFKLRIVNLNNPIESNKITELFNSIRSIGLTHNLDFVYEQSIDSFKNRNILSIEEIKEIDDYLLSFEK